MNLYRAIFIRLLIWPTSSVPHIIKVPLGDPNHAFRGSCLLRENRLGLICVRRRQVLLSCRYNLPQRGTPNAGLLLASNGYQESGRQKNGHPLE